MHFPTLLQTKSSGSFSIVLALGVGIGAAVCIGCCCWLWLLALATRRRKKNQRIKPQHSDDDPDDVEGQMPHIPTSQMVSRGFHNVELLPEAGAEENGKRVCASSC